MGTIVVLSMKTDPLRLLLDKAYRFGMGATTQCAHIVRFILFEIAKGMVRGVSYLWLLCAGEAAGLRVAAG
jgi:hypothetical protein